MALTASTSASFSRSCPASSSPGNSARKQTTEEGLSASAALREAQAADARRAAREGARIRLVTRGERAGGRVRITVAPERGPLGDPLSGPGADNALVLTTDLMGEIGVLERGSTVDQTAHALLSDLPRVAESG